MRLARWSDIKLGTKGLIVVAAPAAATVLIAGAAYLIGSMTEKAEAEKDRAIEATAMIQKLRADEAAGSASARGYLISGDESFTGRIRTSLGEFEATGDKLEALVANSKPQRQRLREIDALQRGRVEMIFEAVAQFRAGVSSPEERRNEALSAERERARMETLIDAMLAEQQRITEERAARVQTLRASLSRVIGICAIGGLAGGCFISALFASGITSRIERLKTNLARLATGEALNPNPVGRDEIGLLNEGIIRTSETLRIKTSALENALQGIAQADASGWLVSFNKACADLLGVDGTQHPINLFSAVLEEDRARVEETLAGARLAGRSEVEALILRPDGSTTDVLITFLPLAGMGGCQVFLRDITLQRKVEEALTRARDAAMASNRAKTQFLAKISHDIRTPLNAILGSADLLSQTPLDADQSEYVDMFRRNSRRLVALINDFLDFSRIEAGAVRVDRTDFRPRQIVDEAVRTFRDLASRKGIDLIVAIEPDVPDSLNGDPVRIQQVLTNLLSNALKFIQLGQVDVRVNVVTIKGKPFLRFDVSDTGPGIAAMDQERIFGLFAQLPNQPPGALTVGCGLGLTICRELVQLMGGDISIDSELGAGSTFRFTVPLILAEQGLRDAGKSPAGRLSSHCPLRPVSILIAEDEEDNRTLLRHYLREHPFDVQFVENGEQALSAVKGPKTFDLILMDMDMPVMDGHAAIRKIRQWEGATRGTAVPIVALSAGVIVDEVRACLDEGCVAHVAKPVDQATLIETIDRHSLGRSSFVDRSRVSDPVKALAPAYLGSKPRQIEEALGHLNNRNFESIRRFGHNLKGTGRGYGFPEIEEAGCRIEKSADEADEMEIARQLHALSRVVSGASNAMTEGPYSRRLQDVREPALHVPEE